MASSSTPQGKCPDKGIRALSTSGLHQLPTPGSEVGAEPATRCGLTPGCPSHPRMAIRRVESLVFARWLLVAGGLLHSYPVQQVGSQKCHHRSLSVGFNLFLSPPIYPPGPDPWGSLPQPCVWSLSLEKQPCSRSPAAGRAPGPQGLQLSSSFPPRPPAR